MIKFGSLFSGIGGIDLGLEWAGMGCAWQVEVEPYCIKVLENHWPNTKRYGDVKQIKWEEVEKVDLICGGFPCQPFSVAGKRRGVTDPRNLWPEMLRATKEIKPRWVLGENVPGLGTYLDTICADLEGEGYEVLPLEIPAAAFGAPHLRYRVFIMAHTKGAGQLRAQQLENNSRRERRWEDTNDSNSKDKIREPDATNSNTKGLEGQWEITRGTKSPLYNISNEGWWTTEPSMGRVAHGVPHRVDRLRALGNAVVPQVAEWLGQRILEVDNE